MGKFELHITNQTLIALHSKETEQQNTTKWIQVYSNDSNLSLQHPKYNQDRSKD